MKKRLFCVLLALSFVSGLAGCDNKETATAEAIPKIVKTQAVAEESVTAGYSYLGIVKAKETKTTHFWQAEKLRKYV